jgi:hypothetical protein
VIFLGLVSKSVVTNFFILDSKPVVTVSPNLASKPVMIFLVEPQNHDGGEFSGLGLKTGSYGLVIWALKSPCQFLSLRLKIKWVTVCRLRHKTDERATVWDTHRDIAACFTVSQSGLKTGGVAMTGGARGTITEVASSPN